MFFDGGAAGPTRLAKGAYRPWRRVALVSLLLSSRAGGDGAGCAAGFAPKTGGGAAPPRHRRRASSCRTSSTTPCRTPTRPLGMSYLDDLSGSPSPRRRDPEEENEGGGGAAGSSSAAPWSKPNAVGGRPTGGVPSGRGPEMSYLEAMTGGGSGDDTSPENDSSSDGVGHSMPEISDFVPPSPEEKQEKPAAWSNTGSYLEGKEKGEPGFMMTAEFEGGDDPRTDVRNLLTQRAIQSFMFLLEECRDPHSAKWIQEDFLQAGNLLDFHGTGAGFIERFGGSWESSLLAMMDRPCTRMIVHAKRRGRGHGGWSKNNPYLKDRFVQIPINIDPVTLASRILEVREQIAQEWYRDLDAVAEANDVVVDSYLSSDGGDGGTRGGGQSPWGTGASGRVFERAEFVPSSAATGAAGFSSSPFRRANFDLLYGLCTQAAMHRLLREDVKNGLGNDRSHTWLCEFYSDRASEYFDGDQPYGRADDFLDGMCRTAPSLDTVERILRKRGEIVREWKETMRHVAEEHNVVVRRVLLTKQAERRSPVEAPPVITTRGEGSEELGAFE